jgi:hypothetical protein
MPNFLNADINMPVNIPLHKGKLSLLLLGSMGFVTMGAWLAINPDQFVNGPVSNPMVIHLVGAAGVLFFGFCAVVAVARLIKNTPALVVDALGIHHYGIAGKPILVHWTDVSALNLVEVGRQKLIMLVVNNPEHYIAQSGNALSRNLMRSNYKRYGAPLGLSATVMRCDINELFNLLSDRLRLYHEEHDRKK